MYRYFTIVILCCLLLASCMSSPYYEKNQSIPHDAWAYDYTPSFKFLVSDTTVYYNLYFLVRHTEAYPYSNIWLRLYSKQPGDTIYQESRVEIQLATNAGQWTGRGMGEIYEQRKYLDQLAFKRKGVYEIKMVQDMRINPLPEILQVGLRVEKTDQPVKAAEPKKTTK